MEVGFLSNPREEALLAQADYRRQVAEAIFYGTVNYLVDSYKKDKPRATDESSPASDSPSYFIDIEDNISLFSRAKAALNLDENEVILYFAGPTNFDDDLLPEVRKIVGLEAESDPNARIKSPTGAYTRSCRWKRSMPYVAAARLRSIKIVGNIAYVDFSKELIENHWGGSRSEELTIYSIVNTLADVSGIKEVRILVEGAQPSTIAGHIILDEPLTPNFDIIEFKQFQP